MMMRIALLVMAALLASCAAKSDVDYLQTRLKQQEQRNKQLEQQLASTAQGLQEEIAKQNQPVRSSQANLGAEVDQLKVRVGSLEGQVDDARRFMEARSQDSQKIDDMTRQLESVRMGLSQLGIDVAPPAATGATAEPEVLMDGPAQAGPAATAAPAKEQAAQQTAAKPAAQSADPAQALYDQGVDSFKAAKYQEALVSFTDFVKSYPKHNLLSNALFWKGESHFQLKDYSNAVLAYQDIIDKYPKSQKYPAALLKQGMAFQRINNPKLAKFRLQELVSKYPKTPEAQRAEAELKNLK